ncbi:unnamed protein product [Penicillium nalgiovense]|nr:unnamed protein product [Penicillium nalgiovense]
MKVLCLHGKGTSGAIFRSQISTFRTKLPDDIEFDFIDGPFKSDAAAGIDIFYNPPYYSFWENDSVDSIRATYDWLTEHIAKNGPYDLALMFSQGCVLGSSALLFHQEETPHLPPPFKAAIFVCGGASLGVLEEMGFPVSAEARERARASRSALAQQATSSALLAQGANRWTGLETLDSGLSEDELRKEITSPYRINVPTVHIYGSKDPRWAAGVHLSGICEPSKRRTYDHGGGHEIPRTAAVSNSIAELFQWAVAQSGSN